MFDWLFHWTHDGEVLKALIPAIGYVFVGAITWIGIWRTSKIAKQTLEDTREATPPELLRLEKWSMILKDSNDYPESIKHKLDLYTIQYTYNDVLKRATLENRVIKLGILNMRVRRELSSLYKVSVGDEHYPRPEWGVPRVNVEKRSKKILAFLIIIALVLDFIFPIWLAAYYEKFDFPYIGLIILYLLIVLIVIRYWYNVTKKTDSKFRTMNIVFRNGYHALKDIYLIREHEGVQETSKENKEREDFEKTKEYKEWENKVKKEHPDWGSWNYGLNIGWDNKPDKAKTDESEPEESTDLASSESISEAPKRQEP